MDCPLKPVYLPQTCVLPNIWTLDVHIYERRLGGLRFFYELIWKNWVVHLSEYLAICKPDWLFTGALPVFVSVEHAVFLSYHLSNAFSSRLYTFLAECVWKWKFRAYLDIKLCRWCKHLDAQSKN